MLYQYAGGSRGSVINTVADRVDDTGHRIWLAPLANETGNPYTTFDYYVRDGKSLSDPTTVTVIVGAPVYLPVVVREME